VTRKLPRLTVDQHIALSHKLIAADRALGTVTCQHKLTPRCRAAARRFAKAMSVIKSELDNDICALTTRADPRNVAIGVYYGEGLARDETQTTPGDVFAGWVSR
jgi:hypothetical protein